MPISLSAPPVGAAVPPLIVDYLPHLPRQLFAASLLWVTLLPFLEWQPGAARCFVLWCAALVLC